MAVIHKFNNMEVCLSRPTWLSHQSCHLLQQRAALSPAVSDFLGGRMVTWDPFCHAAQAAGWQRLVGNASSARLICLGQACFSRSPFLARLTGTSPNISYGNWHPGWLHQGLLPPFAETGVSQEQGSCLSALQPLCSHRHLRTSGKHGHRLPFGTPVAMDFRAYTALPWGSTLTSELYATIRVHVHSEGYQLLWSAPS